MIDADHPAVVAFARTHADGATDDRQRAIRLFYAVRDGIRYDPYHVDLSPRGLSASHTLASGHGWCIPKAVLLAACCRALGMPARLGLADVRNHLSTARLREMMGTDVYYYHGFTTILIGDAWIKATPAFNKELCARMRIAPLDFDGVADALCQPFDLDGQRYLETLAMHGDFDDVPRADVVRTFARHYPRLAELNQANWDEDVAAEAGPEKAV